MMTSSNGSIFRITGPLCEEFTGHRWIPPTKASDTELWWFLWSAPEQTVEQTIERLVIWYAIVLIMTLPLCWKIIFACMLTGICFLFTLIDHCRWAGLLLQHWHTSRKYKYKVCTVSFARRFHEGIVVIIICPLSDGYIILIICDFPSKMWFVGFVLCGLLCIIWTRMSAICSELGIGKRFPQLTKISCWLVSIIASLA